MDLSYSPAYEIREPDTFSKENDLYNLCNYATEGISEVVVHYSFITKTETPSKMYKE